MKMLCLGVKSRWGFNVSKELQSRDGCRVCAEGQKGIAGLHGDMEIHPHGLYLGSVGTVPGGERAA